jgi:hypothetical protein
MLDHFREFQRSVQGFERELPRVRASSVTRAALLESARGVVDGYFRETRLQAAAAGLSADDLSVLDGELHALLEATHSRTPTTKYKSILKRVRSASLDLEKRLLASIPTACWRPNLKSAETRQVRDRRRRYVIYLMD